MSCIPHRAEFSGLRTEPSGDGFNPPESESLFLRRLSPRSPVPSRTTTRSQHPSILRPLQSRCAVGLVASFFQGRGHRWQLLGSDGRAVDLSPQVMATSAAMPAERTPAKRSPNPFGFEQFSNGSTVIQLRPSHPLPSFVCGN